MKVGDLVEWNKTENIIDENNLYRAVRVGKRSGVIIYMETKAKKAWVLCCGKIIKKKTKKLEVINETR